LSTLVHAPHGLAQIGLGLLEGDAGVGGIDLDHGVALLHDLRVVRVDGDHGPANLWRDLYDVAVHIGVVGFDVILRIGVVVDAVGCTRCGKRGGEQRDKKLAFSGFLRGFLGWLRLRLRVRCVHG